MYTNQPQHSQWALCSHYRIKIMILSLPTVFGVRRQKPLIRDRSVLVPMSDKCYMWTVQRHNLIARWCLTDARKISNRLNMCLCDREVRETSNELHRAKLLGCHLQHLLELGVLMCQFVCKGIIIQLQCLQPCCPCWTAIFTASYMFSLQTYLFISNSLCRTCKSCLHSPFHSLTHVLFSLIPFFLCKPAHKQPIITYYFSFGEQSASSENEAGLGKRFFVVCDQSYNVKPLWFQDVWHPTDTYWAWTGEQWQLWRSSGVTKALKVGDQMAPISGDSPRFGWPVPG